MKHVGVLVGGYVQHDMTPVFIGVDCVKEKERGSLELEGSVEGFFLLGFFSSPI